MKVSKAKAAAHRAALLGAACRLLRARGLAGVGIAEIAAEAGLTHGAFYTHFASKEALCAEAIAAMVAESEAGLRGAADLDVYLAAYFSPQHAREVGEGCPFAALIGDVARDCGGARRAFSSGLERVIDALAEHHVGGGRSARRAAAIALLAGMIGGLTMARSVSPPVSAEILAAMRASLKQPKANPALPRRRSARVPTRRK
ncbi:MAG TPA: helix-turn-helix domain-containing protein [Xanthobacteraceae bacterium]|nr:helix-turn-helix domain-containing protein [Xanthobacteraceae bacterium]